MIEYFQINNTPEVKSPIIWDALKAVLRGDLIKMNSNKKEKGGTLLTIEQRNSRNRVKTKKETG